MTDAKPLARTLDFRPMEFGSGSGARLFPAHREPRTLHEGFLDFFADVGTASLGYNSPHARAALARMLGDAIPIHSPNLFQHEERNRAARRLCEATEMDRVFFCNSGTEAAEAAIKAARKYHYDRRGDYSRNDILTAVGGFHGRTMGALAAGDGPRHHLDGFAPLCSGFRRALTPETDFDTLRTDLAAVMLAPVFGNNDVWEYPDGFLLKLSEWCKATGTLLIFDEVQSGSGRTGRMTYAQRIGVKPDIICLAKGVAAGAPVGATLFRGEVAETFTPGSHFSTFGGNPFSCVMVNAMLDWLFGDEDNGAEGAKLWTVSPKGEGLKDAIAERLPKATNVRGPGMLLAFDTPADSITLARECEKRGLLIGAFRKGPGPVKITPPLNVTEDELAEGVSKLAEAHAEAVEISERVGTTS